MMSRLFWLLGGLLVSACSSTQLNYNASDLATSLHSLAKKQVFYNLAAAFDDKQFVPSQVTIASGSAQTANSITPSLSIPLGSGLTNSAATAANGGISSTNQLSFAAPSLGVSVQDSWNQSWTLSPPSDPNQLSRLRELYLYVTGYPGYTAPDTTPGAKSTTRPWTPAEAERHFLCNYPMQALAVGGLGSFNLVFDDADPAVPESSTPNPVQSTTPPPQNQAQPAPTGRRSALSMFGITSRNTAAATPPPAGSTPPKDEQKAVSSGDSGNVIIAVKCPSSPDQVPTAADRTQYFYADPTFLVGPNCVICVDQTRIARAEPGNRVRIFINPRLVYGHVTDGPGTAPTAQQVGSYGSRAFYASKPEYFGNFILFTYEALMQSSNNGNGKTNDAGKVSVLAR
jgi:hypothetical protein